ncbi:MAG: hypothetical protein KJ025_05485 [Burkholderiales bacterium]|nr:hypothetical protein [Burkholderiales bacterium]
MNGPTTICQECLAGAMRRPLNDDLDLVHVHCGHNAAGAVGIARRDELVRWKTDSPIDADNWTRILPSRLNALAATLGAIDVERAERAERAQRAN